MPLYQPISPQRGRNCLSRQTLSVFGHLHGRVSSIRPVQEAISLRSFGAAQEALIVESSGSTMNHLIILYMLAGIYVTATAVANPRAKPRSQEKPINWNLSYYSEPFRTCKTLRDFNPVEKVRAHGAAVEVFRKCGPSIVIPYAQLYRFPAYGE